MEPRYNILLNYILLLLGDNNDWLWADQFETSTSTPRGHTPGI